MPQFLLLLICFTFHSLTADNHRLKSFKHKLPNHPDPTSIWPLRSASLFTSILLISLLFSFGKNPAQIRRNYSRPTLLHTHTPRSVLIGTTLALSCPRANTAWRTHAVPPPHTPYVFVRSCVCVCVHGIVFQPI